MYVLYGGDFTRAPLVQWVLEEANLDYEFRNVDILAGEHRSLEFLAINPAGLVPVLITPQGVALFEVAALLVFLADKHKLSKLAPSPTERDRGLFLSTMFFIAGEIQPEMKRFHFPHRYSLRREDDEQIREQAKTLVISRLGVMNSRLSAQGPFLLGSRFSIADFYLCFWIAYLDRLGICRSLSSIGRLYDLVRSQSNVATYLDETEARAGAYAEMMKNKPGGVIA